MPAVRSLRSAAGTVAVLLAALTAGACDGDGGAATGPEAFCERLREAEPQMVPVTDPASAGTTADLFARLRTHVPEAIRPSWDQLTNVFRAIAALDPADPAIRETVLEQTGRTITAAAEVNAWVLQRCDIDLTAATRMPTTVPTTPPTAPPGATTAPPAAGAASTVPVQPVTTPAPAVSSTAAP